MSSLLKDSGSTNNNSENSSSNGEVGGNNSDNSALVSIGNTSFGFNFDSEDGTNASPHTSCNSEEGDSSDQGDGKSKPRSSSKSGKASGKSGNKNAAVAAASGRAGRPTKTAYPNKGRESGGGHQTLGPQEGQQLMHQKKASALSQHQLQAGMTAGAAAAMISSDSFSGRTSSSRTASSFGSSHSEAAAEAVASLQSIVDASNKRSAERAAGTVPSTGLNLLIIESNTYSHPTRPFAFF
jgi:hypothetical protein